MRGVAVLNMQRLSLRSKPSKVVCFLPNSSQKPGVKVTLRIPKKVAFGQSVAVVGSDPSLGSWNPNSSGISLEWHEGHEWAGSLELPTGEQVEYKYVVRGQDGVLEWQPGHNRVLKVPAESSSEVRVMDSWCGSVHEVQLAGDGSAEPSGQALVESLEEELVQPFAAAQPPPVEAAVPAPAAAEPAPEAAARSSSSGSNGAAPSVTGAEQRAAPNHDQQPATAGGAGALAVAAVTVTKPLEEMTVKQLKELAKELGVPVSGRKMDLVDRIRDAMDAMQ